MENDDYKLELKGLDKLIKALKIKPPIVRIGVLGGGRNSEIGAVHEFGAPSRNIPQRSFLRIPLTDNLNKEMERSGLLNENTLKAVIANGNMVPWIEKVAIVAEGIVDDAFESSGDGKWPKWKDPNYHNEGGMLLVDSGQLRNSITSEVVE